MDGYTSVVFERGEMRLVVNTIPAQVCPGCGETYVKEQVAVNLLRLAEGISAAGEVDTVIEYNEGNSW